MKTIITIVYTNLVTDLLSSFFDLPWNPKTKINFSASLWSCNKNYLLFVYGELCSISKVCQVQQTEIKGFSYMLFLLAL